MSGRERRRGRDNESGRENERGSGEGLDPEVETDTGMEAAHHRIAQDGTAPPAPEKTDLTGIGSESGSIDTKTDTAHALILTGTKRRDPLETDHPTRVTESRPRRDGESVQGKDGAMTERRVRT